MTHVTTPARSNVPVAIADTASTDEVTALTSIDVLGNDTGLGDGNKVGRVVMVGAAECSSRTGLSCRRR